MYVRPCCCCMHAHTSSRCVQLIYMYVPQHSICSHRRALIDWAPLSIPGTAGSAIPISNRSARGSSLGGRRESPAHPESCSTTEQPPARRHQREPGPCQAPTSGAAGSAGMASTPFNISYCVTGTAAMETVDSSEIPARHLPSPGPGTHTLTRCCSCTRSQPRPIMQPSNP
jgi:hypothetical protein